MKWIGVKFLYGISSVFIILFLSGCIETEYDIGTHKQDIFFYSTAKEVAIGRAISHQISAKLKILKDPSYLKRLRSIASKIVAVCDRRDIHYYFYIIDKDEKNAFSLPGGYVYIYKGLMDILTNQELAFVVAHEVGHIVSRHAIKRLQASMGINLLMLASTAVHTNPEFLQGLSFTLAQVMMAYSRQDEFNADELATKYLKLAGFDPTAGIRTLNKLYEEEKKGPIREYSYSRTHPYVAQRISHIKEYLGLPLGINDYIN